MAANRLAPVRVNHREGLAKIGQINTFLLLRQFAQRLLVPVPAFSCSPKVDGHAF